MNLEDHMVSIMEGNLSARDRELEDAKKWIDFFEIDKAIAALIRAKGLFFQANTLRILLKENENEK